VSLTEGQIVADHPHAGGPGDIGKIYAVEMSPMALSSLPAVDPVDDHRTEDSIYVFEVLTGNLPLGLRDF